MTGTRVLIDIDGERAGLSLEGPPPRDVKSGSRFHWDALGPDAAVLLREGVRQHGYFAGSLKSLGVAEVFGILVSGIRSGRLVIQSGAARRSVSLRDGQVVFAASTERYERLGGAIVRLGLISQAQVDEAIREVRPGARLGLVLTQSGRLSAQALYSAMTYLVREIVLNLFELDEGAFIFFEGEPAPKDALKLPEPTRDLVLEGMRRVERTLALRRAWPRQRVLRMGQGALPDVLVSAQTDLEHGVALAGLRNHFLGSEHDFLSLVDELVSAQVLRVEAEHPERAPESSARGSVLELYQGIIAEVAGAVLSLGRDLSSLRAYLAEPGPKLKDAFRNVALSDDGLLDVNQLLTNVAGGNVALDRARAYEALDAFLSYALFSVQNLVSPEEFGRLQDAANVLRDGR